MKVAAFALAVIAAVWSCERVADACAGCSNPNLPTARTGVAVLKPGELSVSMNVTGTTMRVVHSEACPEIGPICQKRAEPPQLHDQRFYVGELRPIVAFGVSDRFAVEAQVPFRLVNTTIQFRRLDGAPFEPDYENIHHRNETLAGAADPWLLGRATGTIGKLGVTTRGGLGLPVGRTEEDPFARARAGLPHQHVQFGTGTFHPVFAVDVGTALGPTRLGAYAQAALFVLENGYGYRAGNRFSGGVSGDTELIRQVRIGLGADVLNEQPERWGRVVQQDGNVGRTDVLVGGGISYVVDASVLSASVRVPVVQHFIETSHADAKEPGQLTYPAIVHLSVATTFGRTSGAAPKSGVLPEP